VTTRPDDPRSPAERELERRSGITDLRGKPLPRRLRQTERTLEAYLRGGVMPRFMTRLNEIEDETGEHKRRLAAAYRHLRRECGEDAEAFAERWRERARRWSFAELNQLIREHNEWYPIERQLPMDPRTRDYVKVCGRSYRREQLGPDWILDRFPAQ
jgi:hypothetical protein